MKERLKAALAFVLAWLSTPSSRAGVMAILTAVLGKYLAPTVIEAVYWTVLVGAGVLLILWPQKQ
jgi:hypothetical protein